MTRADEDEEAEVGAGDDGLAFFPLEVIVLVVEEGVVDVGVGAGAGACASGAVVDAEDFLFFLLPIGLLPPIRLWLVHNSNVCKHRLLYCPPTQTSELPPFLG